MDELQLFYDSLTINIVSSSSTSHVKGLRGRIRPQGRSLLSSDLDSHASIWGILFMDTFRIRSFVTLEVHSLSSAALGSRRASQRAVGSGFQPI